MRKLRCTVECCRETRAPGPSNPRRAAATRTVDLRGRQASPARGRSISRSWVKSMMTSQPARPSNAVLRNDCMVRAFALCCVELLDHGKADGLVVVRFQHVALLRDGVERVLVLLAAAEDLPVLFRIARVGRLSGCPPLAGLAVAVVVMGADWAVEATDARLESPGYQTCPRQWLQMVGIAGRLYL